MTRKEIEFRYQSVCTGIFSKKLKPALGELERLLKTTQHPSLYYQWESIAENYRTLLKYSYEGYKDPMQESIFKSICADMLSMADDLRHLLITPEQQFKKYQNNLLQTEFGTESQQVASRIEFLFFGKNREAGMGEAKSGQDANFVHHPDLHQTDRIFKAIWLTGKIDTGFFILIQRIVHSPLVEWHIKCLITSALTLSTLNYFDSQKLLLLIELAEMRENQVYQRALTGLLLLLIIYDQRLVYYPVLYERLKKFSSDESFIPEIEFILMQLLKAKETDRITREFEEEVLPEMKKMMPKIEDKLQLNDLTENEELEGKNPGWKDMMEEVPGLFEKIEKFSRLQMDGGDVFMSTFRMLKRFDFFNLISNWFVPFHMEHPEITDSFPIHESINERLLASLDKAFYICNSDKYSFAINFKSIPDQQRTMIVANFEAEFAQMQEMATEEQLLDQSLVSNSVFIQYIQDLYRFFKLFPSKAEFDDVFQTQIRPATLGFYTDFFNRTIFIEKVAAHYFDKEHFSLAIDAYADVMKRKGAWGEYFEKTAYCYQKLGQFSYAIEAYKKAELFDGDHLWLNKKIGWCYLKIRDYENALRYFKEAAALNPEDAGLQLQVGQCYLNLKDYEKALHQYLNARFFDPDNLKVLRPIAYCQFVLGKMDAARETYEKILSAAAAPTAYDMMNAAHVMLCLHLRSEALRLYRDSFFQPSPSKAELLNAFDEDLPHLVQNGISEKEIPLIRDYLLFQTEL